MKPLEPKGSLQKIKYGIFHRDVWQSFTIRGKIVADATLVAVLGPTILSLKTDDNSGGTHFRIRLCNA